MVSQFRWVVRAQRTGRWLRLCEPLQILPRALEIWLQLDRRLQLLDRLAPAPEFLEREPEPPVTLGQRRPARFGLLRQVFAQRPLGDIQMRARLGQRAPGLEVWRELIGHRLLRV